MCQGDWFAIIGSPAIFKGQTNGFSDRGLIAFGDENIVTKSLFDKIVGQFALCEQRIAGDRFTVNIERIDNGDEHSDFIGLFELVAFCYRQSTDFFWVWQVPDS